MAGPSAPPPTHTHYLVLGKVSGQALATPLSCLVNRQVPGQASTPSSLSPTWSSISEAFGQTLVNPLTLYPTWSPGRCLARLQFPPLYPTWSTVRCTLSKASGQASTPFPPPSILPYLVLSQVPGQAPAQFGAALGVPPKRLLHDDARPAGAASVCMRGVSARMQGLEVRPHMHVHVCVRAHVCLYMGA